jgi:hypothetical protein
MCSSNDVATEPFARFGLTEQDFKALLCAHNIMNYTGSRARSCNEMPFFDWEADELAKIFAHFKDNQALCGIIAAMMQLKHDAEKRRQTAHKVPTRKDTYGGFYPPPRSAMQEKST